MSAQARPLSRNTRSDASIDGRAPAGAGASRANSANTSAVTRTTAVAIQNGAASPQALTIFGPVKPASTEPTIPIP